MNISTSIPWLKILLFLCLVLFVDVMVSIVYWSLMPVSPAFENFSLIFALVFVAVIVFTPAMVSRMIWKDDGAYNLMAVNANNVIVMAAYLYLVFRPIWLITESLMGK